MESKKYSGYNNNVMHKATSASAIGSSVNVHRNTLSEGGSCHADALPPKAPPSTTTTTGLGPSSNSGGNKGTSYLRSAHFYK